METKNPTEMVLKELQFLFPENFHAVAPHTPGGGGLFLTWKKEIELTILSLYIKLHQHTYHEQRNLFPNNLRLWRA